MPPFKVIVSTLTGTVLGGPADRGSNFGSPGIFLEGAQEGRTHGGPG